MSTLKAHNVFSLLNFNFSLIMDEFMSSKINKKKIHFYSKGFMAQILRLKGYTFSLFSFSYENVLKDCFICYVFLYYKQIKKESDSIFMILILKILCS